MIEIDLLKFFDKSYSEIDEILHEKGDYEEELEEKKEIQGAIEKKSLLRSFKYVSIILVLCIFVFICFRFLYPRIMDVLNDSKPVREAKVSNEELAKDTKVTQKLQDHLENENNNEIVVATIDFLVDNLTEYVSSNKINNKERTDVNSEKVKQEAKKALYKVKLYYIEKSDLDRINSFAPKNNLAVEKLGTNVHRYVVWSLYMPKKGTNKYIGGREAAFIKSFKNKKEAVNYARNKGIAAIIVKESRKKYSYDIIVKGFNSKEDANDFINRFNIEKEKYRIEKVNIK